MKLSKTLTQKLHQMKLLNARIQMSNDDHEIMELCDEYNPLKEGMIEEFLPLIDMLAKAGLIGIDFQDDDQDYIKGDYDRLGLDAEYAYENGVIQLFAKNVSSMCPNAAKQAEFKKEREETNKAQEIEEDVNLN